MTCSSASRSADRYAPSLSRRACPRALVAAASCALLLAGCSQSLEGGAADSGRPSRAGSQAHGSPDGSGGSPSPQRGARSPRGASQGTAPSSPLVTRLDGLLRGWDEAQGASELGQAESLRHQLRMEVDGHLPQVLRAADGGEGARAQLVAVSALGFASDAQATAALIRATGGPSPQVVGNALIAISLRRDPNTPLGPILGRMTRGSHQDVRRFAPLALANVLAARRDANLGAEPGTRGTALVRLSALARDHDGVVRLHVAKALGALGHPAAVELLMRMIRDDRARVRVAAAAALERTGDPRGFPLVVRLLHETSGGGKRLISDLLASYAGRMQGRPLDATELTYLGVGATRWSHWYDRHMQTRGETPGGA